MDDQQLEIDALKGRILEIIADYSELNERYEKLQRILIIKDNELVAVKHMHSLANTFPDEE